MVNLRCELCDAWLSLFQVGKLCNTCYEIRTIVKCYDAESIKLCLEENFKVINDYKSNDSDSESEDEDCNNKKCLTESQCECNDADDEKDEKIKVKKLDKEQLEAKVKEIIKKK